MIETLSPPSAAPPAAPRRRRRLLALGVAAVAVAGIGVGIALASPSDTPNQAATPVSQATTPGRQVAMLNQACTNWLDDNPTANTPRAWCDNMTGWMNQQIANGSMNHQMMWNNPDQMRDHVPSLDERQPVRRDPQQLVRLRRQRHVAAHERELGSPRRLGQLDDRSPNDGQLNPLSSVQPAQDSNVTYGGRCRRSNGLVATSLGRYSRWR